MNSVLQNLREHAGLCSSFMTFALPQALRPGGRLTLSGVVQGIAEDGNNGSVGLFPCADA